jgi:hypothetical protein
MKLSEKQLLALLAECAHACHHCSTACLREEDVKMMATCIKLDMDCAQICELTAAFVSRGSDHAKHALKECAEICSKCADECEKHEHMEHCKKCADACRKCADACRKAASPVFSGYV